MYRDRDALPQEQDLTVISDPKEDYLSAIYRIQREEETANTGRVAAILGVSSASATHMFQKLADEGLVEYTEYVGVQLTPAGVEAALDVIRRHRLAERFLTDILGIGWHEVDAMAHKMEHALPAEVIEGLDHILGRPATCPHGYPIPDRDGDVDEPDLPSLNELEPGQRARIARVREGDSELLKFLAESDLVPGRSIHVQARAPYDRLLTLAVGDDGHEVVIGQQVASSIFVNPVEETPTRGQDDAGGAGA